MIGNELVIAYLKLCDMFIFIILLIPSRYKFEFPFTMVLHNKCNTVSLNTRNIFESAQYFVNPCSEKVQRGLPKVIKIYERVLKILYVFNY